MGGKKVMEREKEGDKEWWTIRRREKRKRGKTKKTMLKEIIICNKKMQ